MRLPGARHKLPLGTYVGIAVRASVLKSLWYSLRFRGLVVVGRGSKLSVHRSASLRVERGLLAIGVSSPSALGSTVELRPRSALRISGLVQVFGGASVRLNLHAEVSLGHQTYLNEGATLNASQRVELGARCAIASRVAIMDTDTHGVVVDGAERERTRAVTIGDDVWIGTGAIVLKGAHIGDGSVVAAGSLVNRDVVPRSLVGGVPARELARDVSWTI